MKMKIYEHDAGHMTNMAFMPIYGKTPPKSSPVPVDRFPRNMVCGIEDFCQSYLTYSMTRTNFVT